MNPISLALTLICAAVAVTLVLVRVAVGDSIPWSGLVQGLGLGLLLACADAANVLAAVGHGPNVTGLPASL